MLPQYFVSIFVGTFLVIFCIEILRRNSIEEKYAITWLFVSFLALIFALFPGFVEKLSSALSIKTPSNFIFFFAIVFLAIINMQIILEVGRNKSQIKILVEKIAELSIQHPKNEKN
jgi:hypothetical protein